MEKSVTRRAAILGCFLGTFGIISRCFSLRGAWSSFFVMPILIIFTDAHIKWLTAGKRA